MSPEELATRKDLLNLRQDLLNDFKSIIEKHVKPEKEWLKSKEVKALLGISTGTLHNLIAQGKLKPKKLGGTLYFSGSEIKELLK